jgi:hypothetical protein
MLRNEIALRKLPDPWPWLRLLQTLPFEHARYPCPRSSHASQDDSLLDKSPSSEFSVIHGPPSYLVLSTAVFTQPRSITPSGLQDVSALLV